MYVGEGVLDSGVPRIALSKDRLTVCMAIAPFCVGPLVPILLPDDAVDPHLSIEHVGLRE